MVTVQINSTDRTKLVDWKSLNISNILTKQVDTCTFDILKYGTRTFNPVAGQDVKVYDNGVLVFGGIISKIKETTDGMRVVRYNCTCQDYAKLLDRKLVVDTFTNQTVAQIINFIITNYDLDTDESITTTNVDCDINIKYIGFNYEPASKCIQQLAELVNYDWYIDYSKDIHFFSAENIPAPFNLTDGSANYDYQSLILRKDSSQIKNSIYVRGGEYLANTVTIEQLADGEQITFPASYKFSDIKVTVTGEVQNTGVDYLNDPNLFDCLHNFQEKLVRFRDDNKPSINSAVRISGRPYIPVIVDFRDDVAIAQMASIEGGSGEYESLIYDLSIISKEAARDRALAEITTYKTTLSEGEFKTHVSGLRAGQLINITSSVRGSNEDMIINKVVARMLNPERMTYSVNLVTAKTMGIIDFLQSIILRDRRQITVKADEVLDKVRSISEILSISEVIASAVASEIAETATISENIRQNPFNPPDWVLALWTVTGESDTKRNGTFDVSMYLY